MLISSVLSVAAIFTFQADPARASREAFSRCLFQYADKAAQDRTSPSDFDGAFPQQCQQQERAFRDAIRTSAGRMSATDVEEMQNMEIEDARANAKARFEDATSPQT